MNKPTQDEFTLTSDSRPWNGVEFASYAGFDKCPECGYTKNLFSCKHCGKTMCMACWQSHDDWCPRCGRRP